MTRCKVLIVDDHPLFRAGLRSVLEAQKGVSVVGEAGNDEEACALAVAQDPDVVVLDISLPGPSGITVAQNLRRLAPRARVLMLSLQVDRSCLEQALAAGAVGYVVKGEEPQSVINAIRAAADNRRYLSPSIAGLLPSKWLPPGKGAAGTPRQLSPREQEVFALLARGVSNQGIARQLSIGVKSVATRRGNVLRKLGLHSITDLVRYAARHGQALD